MIIAAMQPIMMGKIREYIFSRYIQLNTVQA